MVAGSVLCTHEYPLGSAALNRQSSRVSHPPLLISQGFDTVVTTNVYDMRRKGRPRFMEYVEEKRKRKETSVCVLAGAGIAVQFRVD